MTNYKKKANRNLSPFSYFMDLLKNTGLLVFSFCFFSGNRYMDRFISYMTLVHIQAYAVGVYDTGNPFVPRGVVEAEAAGVGVAVDTEIVSCTL
jgi:hypothetical protein